jgi:hypothetical protein
VPYLPHSPWFDQWNSVWYNEISAKGMPMYCITCTYFIQQWQWIFFAVCTYCDSCGTISSLVYVFWISDILLHTCTPRPQRDILGHLYFHWFIVILIFFVLELYLVLCLYLCTVNFALCHAPVWLLPSTLDTQNKVQTHMTFVVEALSLD